MNRRLAKRDVIFIGAIIILLFAVFIFWNYAEKEKGSKIEITVAGECVGTYFLDENQQISIKNSKGIITNVLEIKDGAAYMIKADCPDKLCIHQKAIAKDKETIVCLPNQVVVTVISDKDFEYDSIAQ